MTALAGLAACRFLPSEPNPESGSGAAPALSDLARGDEATVEFTTDTTGEVIIEATGSATGVSWATPGAESAVVSLFIDDRYVSDLVVASSKPAARAVAVGELADGPHTLRVQFASDRSPPGAESVTLDDIRIETIAPGDPAYIAARHSPVLYGRTVDGRLPTDPPFQNAVTDTPLLAWHTLSEADVNGNRVLEYTMLWSNEDGGTSTPALMASWGRTTDVEWTYRVEVDQAGQAIPATATFQAPEHTLTAFAGRYEGSHPVLATCTLNNNVCDSVGSQTGAPMRFALAATETLGPGEPREAMMDRHPWTYQVMADEVRREGQVADQPVLGVQIHDPSEYLYVMVDRTTTGTPNSTDDSTDDAVGLALGVRLAHDPMVYRSDVGFPPWAIEREGMVATAVHLPAGTDADDIVGIDAIRVVGWATDSGAAVSVTTVERAFLLDGDGLPVPITALAIEATPVTLSADEPVAALYRVG